MCPSQVVYILAQTQTVATEMPAKYQHLLFKDMQVLWFPGWHNNMPRDQILTMVKDFVSQLSCTRQDLIHTELILGRKQPQELTAAACRVCVQIQGVPCWRALQCPSWGFLKTFLLFSSITVVSEALPDIKRLSWFCSERVWFHISPSALGGCFLKRKSPDGSACPGHFSALNNTTVAAFPAEQWKQGPKISMETLQFTIYLK